MSAESKPELFDATLRVDNLPAAGKVLAIDAGPDDLARLAALMQVSSVDSFAAQITVEKFRGGVRAVGDLQARVTQPCIVTFEPVVQEISEPVDRIFLPDPDIASDSAPGSEVFVDLEGDDIPDHLSGPELDLAPLLLEVLGLAIDLYPRAPGAELPEGADDGDDDSLNPFAALKSLKAGSDGAE